MILMSMRRSTSEQLIPTCGQSRERPRRHDHYMIVTALHQLRLANIFLGLRHYLFEPIDDLGYQTQLHAKDVA